MNPNTFILVQPKDLFSFTVILVSSLPFSLLEMQLERSIINRYNYPLYSLQLDRINRTSFSTHSPPANHLYSLNSKGIINVWDLSEFRIISNIYIPIETKAVHPTKMDSHQSHNKLEWLSDTSYLILFEGNLYFWDSLSLSITFCSAVCNYSTHSECIQVRDFIRDQSVVFVVYR